MSSTSEKCPCCGFEGKPGQRACQVEGEDSCRQCTRAKGRPGNPCGRAFNDGVPPCRIPALDEGHPYRPEATPAVVEGELVDPGTPFGYERQALERVHAAQKKTLEGIFELGTILVEAKQRIDHGRWIPWLEIAGLGRSTAERLMRIATDDKLHNLRIANAAHAPHLPPSRETLYQLTRLSETEFGALVEAGKIHPEMTRSDLKVALASKRNGSRPALPAPTEGRYGAILADPPWRFETRGTGARAAAERHYPTMELAEIELLPVMNLAADDALLFLWVTSERLADAPRVMLQWGFELVSTAFVWVKDGQPGLGYWTRKGSELCLLGKRGNPKRLATDVAEVIHAVRGRHSEKPVEVYRRIERLAAGPYIELFARAVRPGWDAWGNDPAVTGRDECSPEGPCDALAEMIAEGARNADAMLASSSNHNNGESP